MAILFDSTRPRQSSRQFGRGIVRSVPSQRVDYPDADLAWYIAHSARREEQARNRMLDQQAEVFAVQSRMDAGLPIL